jgi:arylsulfatase A-like enzyme
VTDNDNLRHAYPTALEVARERLGLGFQEVAQLGSWEGFKLAAASRDEAFLMVGAHDSVPPPWGTPQIDQLAALRRQVMGLWEEGSNDTLTFRMAQAYLEKNRPRVLWLALVNSDDWAHADRYDRYLAYLHLADSLLGELWQTLQSLEGYRDRTTLIVTTDHGRGLQGADWAEHDITIPGSDDIWLAVIGPDTPDLGEVRAQGTVYQGQVAGTLLQFLGLDARELDPQALPPVPGSLAPPTAPTESEP